MWHPRRAAPRSASRLYRRAGTGAQAVAAAKFRRPARPGYLQSHLAVSAQRQFRADRPRRRREVRFIPNSALLLRADRKSVVKDKSESVRVALVARRSIRKNKTRKLNR